MNHKESSAGESPALPKTTPITDALSQLIKPLEQLPDQVRESVVKSLLRQGAHMQLRIPPHQIQFGPWANRHRDSLRDAAFDALRADIEASGGNQVPIIVRPISGPESRILMERDVLYEVVAGHRRLRACQALNLEVNAIVMAEMTDQEVASLMHAENAQRKSLVPCEVGAMYNTWLDQKIYGSQQELAQALHLTPSEVSRALGLARLHPDILGAFASPTELQYKDVDEIRGLLKIDQAKVLEAAREIASQERKMSRTRVLEVLRLAVAGGGKIGSANFRRKAALTVAGKEVAQVRWDTSGSAKIHVQHALDEAAQQRLQDLLEKFFIKELDQAKSKPRQSAA